MNYTNKELLFISNLQTKLGNNTLNRDKNEYNFDSKEFRENREIMIILDFFANSRYNYIDDNGNSTYYHKCDIEENKLLRWIDFFRHRYRIGNIPFIDYPKRTTNVIFDLLCGDGFALPEGGGPGYYLTKNSVGELIWERINDCLFSQTFVTGPASENPAPYRFTLNSTPEKIFQIFINGQLLLSENLYVHEDNIVTLLSPIVLDNAVVKIFGGCDSLSFMDGGSSSNEEEENFIWFEGDPYIFTTLINLNKVKHVFINGNRYRHNYDYIYTVGEAELTILQDAVVLEDGDEVDIIFEPFIGEAPGPPTTTNSTFDTSFDETFIGTT